MLYIGCMIRTQLYVPKSQYEELKELARRRGQTFASLAREMLREKLQDIKINRRKSKPKNPAAVMLASLKEIEALKEPGVIRKGSTELDTYLYSHNPPKP